MDHRQALPIGTKLYEFEILSVLGSGGFGVVYLAKDTNLGEDIVIKEYLPNQYAVRESDQTVKAKSIRDEEEFQWGLDRFLAEAQALAAFRTYPNIVNVLRYFRANNTGYMVMEYIKGASLGSYLEKHEVLSEVQIRTLIFPLLDALETVHQAGVIHRDLKPDNILINDKGQPVLIDFGAARHAIGAKSLNITSIISPGYSPFEQYTTSAKQGPWTDIYALGGVMYRSVTGKKPTDAIARKDSDDYTSVKEKLATKHTYSESLLKAIDWALQLNAKDRPQSIEEWEKVLDNQEESVVLDEETPVIERNSSASIKKPLKLVLITGIGMVIFIIAASTFYIYKPFFIPKEIPPVNFVKPVIVKPNTAQIDDAQNKIISDYINLAIIDASKIIRNQNKIEYQNGMLNDTIALMQMSPSDTKYAEMKKNAEKGLKELKAVNMNLIDNYASYIKNTCNTSGSDIQKNKNSLKFNSIQLKKLADIFLLHREQYCKTSIIDDEKWIKDFVTTDE